MEYKLLSITTCNFSFLNKAQNNINYELNPKFGKGIKKIDASTYELHLVFSLHDNEDKPSPYDIDLEIAGIFKLNSNSEMQKEEFMNLNAISILFPYLRTILSTSMSAMMVSPIILPIVDAKKLFKKTI